MVPFAHASDGGGSIRIPAAACGLVGLKTSRGRTSVGPASDELARPLSVQFAVTRSVRDAAALLDAVVGPETGDPVTPPPPTNRYATMVNTEPTPLRIGLMTTIPARATRRTRNVSPPRSRRPGSSKPPVTTWRSPTPPRSTRRSA